MGKEKINNKNMKQKCIKAKQGDKIKIIADTCLHGFKIGSEHIVDHIHEYPDGDKDYRVFDANRCPTESGWALTDDDIELVKL